MAFAPLFLGRARRSFNKIIAGQMGVFAGTERQCTEDEHDDEKQFPKFGIWVKTRVCLKG
jgi:hypothetical protein